MSTTDAAATTALQLQLHPSPEQQRVLAATKIEVDSKEGFLAQFPISEQQPELFSRVIDIARPLDSSIESDQFHCLAQSLLLLAAIHNHVPLAQSLLEHCFSRNDKIWTAACDAHRSTALHFACAHGNVEMIRLLTQPHILRGSLIVNQPRSSSLDHMTPFCLAARFGHTAACAALVQGCIHHNNSAAAPPEESKVTLDKEQGGQRMAPALWHAARHNHASVVEVLLKSGCNVNAADLEQYSALVAACRASEFDSHLQVVQLLLSSRECLVNDTRNLHKVSALMFACRDGNPKLVDALLAAGADPTIYDSYGKSALIHCLSLRVPTALSEFFVDRQTTAHRRAAAESALLLIDKLGAQEACAMSRTQGAETTAVHLAVARGCMPVLEKLTARLKATNDAALTTQLLDQRDASGCTPLYLACCSCSASNDYEVRPVDIVKMLIDAGCNPGKAVTSAGWSCLAAAIDHSDDPELVDFLLSVLSSASAPKSPPSSSSSSIVSPLRLAVSRGRARILALLLQRRQEQQLSEQEGRSLVQIAAENGDSVCLRELIELGMRGWDAEKRRDVARSALQIAVALGKVDVVRYLLMELKCNVSDDSTSQFSLLFKSALTGFRDASSAANQQQQQQQQHENNDDYLRILELLMVSSPSVKSLNSALQQAAMLGNDARPLQVLLQKHSSTSTSSSSSSSSGWTLLHFAAWHRTSAECLKFMLSLPQFKALINEQAIPQQQTEEVEQHHHLGSGITHQTPLYIACERGNLEAVRVLLANGANPNIPTSADVPPVAIAVQFGHEEIVRALIDDKAEHCKPVMKGRWKSVRDLALDMGQKRLALLF